MMIALASMFVIASSVPVGDTVTTSASLPHDVTMVEARAYFEEGRAAYAQGRFDVARAWFRKAWERKKLPELLFNVAQCDAQLGEHERAVRHYQQYLDLSPTSGNRALVTDLIAQSKAALQRRSATTTSPLDGVRSGIAVLVPDALLGDGSVRSPSPNVVIDGDEPIVWAGAVAAGALVVLAVGTTAWVVTQSR